MFVYVPQVKLEDIGGLVEAKAALHEMIVLPRMVCAVCVCLEGGREGGWVGRWVGGWEGGWVGGR